MKKNQYIFLFLVLGVFNQIYSSEALNQVSATLDNLQETINSDAAQALLDNDVRRHIARLRANESFDEVRTVLENPRSSIVSGIIAVISSKSSSLVSQLTGELSRHACRELIDLISHYARRKIDRMDDKTFSVIKPNQIQERLSSLGGYYAEKDACMPLFDYLKNPQDYIKKGAKIIKGLLLSGAPGTGKTLFAKSIAGQMGCPLIMVTASQLIAGNQSEKTSSDNIETLFNLARSWAKFDKPCIVFFEEIDAIGKQRNKDLNSDHTDILTSLLTELDKEDKKHPVLFIATTNHKDHLDQALIRPGRIDLAIDIKLPNKQERVEILKIHLQNIPHLKDINLAAIADRSPNMSGADLAHIVQIASRIIMEKGIPEITDQTLQQALDLKLFGCSKEEFIHPLNIVKAYHQATRALIIKQKESDVVINSITIAPGKHEKQKFEGIVYTAAKVVCATEQTIRNEISEYLASSCVEKIFFDTTTDIGLHDRQIAKDLAAKCKVTYNSSQTVEEILLTQESEVIESIQRYKQNITEIAAKLSDKKILYEDELKSLLPSINIKDFLKQEKLKFKHNALKCESLAKRCESGTF